MHTVFETKHIGSIVRVSLGLILLVFVTIYNSIPANSADSASSPSAKITSRATTSIVTFFLGDESGYELSVPEGSNPSIGIRLSEANKTADVSFVLAYSGASTALPNSNFLIPDPTNSGQPNTKTSVVVTIPAGQTETSFPLQITNNLFDEDDKIIVFDIFELSGAISASNTLKITIRDDEKAPTVELKTGNTSILESDGAVKIEIKLIGSVSSKPIIVTYQLENSPEMAMFVPNGTGEYDYFDPSVDNPSTDPQKCSGNTSGQFTVDKEKNGCTLVIGFINDVIAENQEQLTIKLTGADNANISDTKNQLVITVVDEDATASKLTDTGVTTCFDDLKNSMDCFNNPDFPIQDGAITLPRNFIKIDSNGLRVNDGVAWSCVYDADTSLLWEVKPSLDGNLFPDRDQNLYTWLNTASSVNGGSEGTEGGQNSCTTPSCDSAHYVEILNTENTIGHCGVRKWRVPSLKELMSLLDFEPVSNDFLIDTQYFSDTSNTDYWTSTPTVINKDNVWCIDFQKNTTNQIKQCRKDQNRLLRLVSTCKLGSDRVDC